LDIFDRFDAVNKSIADTFGPEGAPSGGSTLHENLKPYRDQTVVYAHVVTRSPHVFVVTPFPPTFPPTNPTLIPDNQAPHVNYGPDTSIPNGPVATFQDFSRGDRDRATFACYLDQDADLDYRLKVDTGTLESDFYTTGWGSRDVGPQVFQLKFNSASSLFPQLNYATGDAYLGAEAIMYGKVGMCSKVLDSSGALRTKANING
jgi:hypothetical protein